MERASSSLDEASKSEGNGMLLPAVAVFQLCASTCHAEYFAHLLNLSSSKIVPPGRCCSISTLCHAHTTCAVRLSAENATPCMGGKQMLIFFLLSGILLRPTQGFSLI